MSRKQSRKKKKKQQRARKEPTSARQADKYKLYEEAVQEPEADVKFAERVFKKRFGRPPRLLREDFCGTSALACEWVRHHSNNRAWGVDIDPEPLAWGTAQNVAQLTSEGQGRIELIQGDVLETTLDSVDITVAFNFSYFLFKTRPALGAYFEKARTTLCDEGLFLLDAYGGPEAQQTMSESQEFEGFDYVWDQYQFNPIHHDVVNYIHFEFPDGSRMHRAFHYEWRLWTLPEIQELLIEAGFKETEVYWEGVDQETGEGNGVYRKTNVAPDDPAWIAYIVGVC